MSANERLMVAAMLGDLQQGEQLASLPAHLTIYPWFDLPVDMWPFFDEGMSDVVEATQAPTIKGGTRVFYGPQESISARRLDQPTPTFNVLSGFDIHAGVYRLVHELGSALDDTYTGLRWSPHISDTAERQFNTSEELRLTQITVLEKDIERGRKIVRAIYEWGDF